MTCKICKGTGFYVKNKEVEITDLFSQIFDSFFKEPCPYCGRGQQEAKRSEAKRSEAERVREAEAKRVREAEAERVREVARWRHDIWGVVQDLIAPCQEALSYGNLDRDDKLKKKNCLARTLDKIRLAEEWALNEALDIPDDGTSWSRSHPDKIYIKAFVSLDDRERRLEWVKEKVPFALKAHEDYYHALDNYPVIYQIEDIIAPLHKYVFGSLPEGHSSDYTLNQEYERLCPLVEAYKEEVGH